MSLETCKFRFDSITPEILISDLRSIDRFIIRVPVFNVKINSRYEKFNEAIRPSSNYVRCYFRFSWFIEPDQPNQNSTGIIGCKFFQTKIQKHLFCIQLEILDRSIQFLTNISQKNLISIEIENPLSHIIHFNLNCK